MPIFVHVNHQPGHVDLVNCPACVDRVIYDFERTIYVDDRACRDNGHIWPDLAAGEDSSWAIDIGGRAIDRTRVFQHLD